MHEPNRESQRLERCLQKLQTSLANEEQKSWRLNEGYPKTARPSESTFVGLRTTAFQMWRHLRPDNTAKGQGRTVMHWRASGSCWPSQRTRLFLLLSGCPGTFSHSNHLRLTVSVCSGCDISGPLLVLVGRRKKARSVKKVQAGGGIHSARLPTLTLYVSGF